MKKPNILFFFPDQHRNDWLGWNKELPLKTPNIDNLCKNGVRFTQAFTPSPLCSPARACLATGLDYPNCGVKGNSDNTPLSLPTYYQKLRDVGYEVAGVGKFDLHKPDLDWGLDGSKLIKEYGLTIGIDNEGKGDAIYSYKKNDNSPKGPYMQFLKERGLHQKHLNMYEPYMGTSEWLNFAEVTDLPDDAYCDNWVAENGIRCLEEFPKNKPWHLVVNFVGPHGPFDVTKEMRNDWKAVPFPEALNATDSKEYVLERQQNYAAMIENIDKHVGNMIEVVKERGELENTIIVYASDHGEMLGDHGRWAKSVWYTASAEIPMIIAGPNIEQGKTSDALVALHDLTATFLEFSGAENIEGSEALSLCPVLKNSTDTHRKFVKSGLHKWRMVYDGRYKYVRREGEDDLLYDTEKDPNECHNIASTNNEIVNRLSQLINSKKQKIKNKENV